MHEYIRCKLVGTVALVVVCAIFVGASCTTSAPGGGGGGGANAGENADPNDNVAPDANQNANENANEDGNENTNTNDNENDNENENVNDNSSVPDLSADVTDAVDLVEIELEAFAKGLASFMDVLDPQAEVETDEIATYGACPLATAGGATDGIVIALDYGDGCTNARYGDDQLSGTLTVTVIEQTYGSVITDFAIDGALLVGTVNANRLDDTAAGATLQGNVAFTSDEIGQGIGTATFSFNLTRSVISIIEAEIALKNTTDVTDTPDTISYDATLENVVINPLGNGNFTPQSGTLSFEGPGDSGTVVIIYSPESPVSGAVNVSVDGAANVEYVAATD